MSDSTSEPAVNPSKAIASRTAKRPAIAMAVVVLGGVLFLDAAIETFLAGSALRWWGIGAAVVYASAIAAIWRLNVGWRAFLAITILGLFALIAATAWMPGGLTDGIRLAGQPTPRLLAVLAAAGIALASLTIVRAKLPLAARIVAGVLAAYGVAAFLAGASANTSLAGLLSGQSLWSRLPTVLQGAFIGGLVVLPVGLLWLIVAAGLRRPAVTSLRAEAWKIVALVTSFATVLAGLPLRSGRANVSAGGGAEPENLAALLGIDPNAPKLSPAELNSALTNSLRAIEDGEREAPRDRWDLEYVATMLGNDPQRIFAWVQTNTFWIPYRGLLRGSAGVLMDRLGNSLDRAALLAMLLRQAGQVVRLARGSLLAPQALQQVRASLLARYAALPTAIAEGRTGDLTAIAAQYKLDEGSLRRTLSAQAEFAARKHARLLERIPDQTQRLAAAIGSRPEDQSGAAFDRVLEAAQDHWWVQLLDNGAWRDFDLGTSAAGTTLTTAEEAPEIDTFPDELRHRITVRVIAEQWADGALSEHIALEDVLTPSQLIGVPVVLRFMPYKWPATFPLPNTTPEQALRTLAMERHEWTPGFIVGKKSEIQMAIRDTGDVAPPRDPAQELGEAAGGKMGGLAKSLDDALGPPTLPNQETSPSTFLTATWIEYEIQQPGEQPQKIRRALFDLVGPSARAVSASTAPRIDEAGILTRSLALMRETEILPVVCRFVPEFLTHVAAQSVLANRAVLTELVQANTGAVDFADVQKLLKRLTPAPTPLYGLASARFEWSRFGDEIYLDKPNILTRHTFLAPAAERFKLVVATDIVANDIGVDPLANDPFVIRLEQGVVDTNAEAILASERRDTPNTGSAYVDSGSWTTIRSAGDQKFNSLKLPDDVRTRIGNDLRDGYLVVAPTAPVTMGGDAFSGWWRVNPATGQALGMGSTGWGSEFVEYLIVLYLDFYIGAMLQFMICKMLGGPDGACMQQALIAGLIAGIFSAALMGASALGAWSGRAAGSGLGAAAGSEAGAAAGGGAPPKGPGNTQPLDPLPFDKTQPGGPAGGKPGPGPSPEPAPDPYFWGQPASPELQQAVDKFRAADKNLSDFFAKVQDRRANEILKSPTYQKLADEWSKAFGEWSKFKPPAPPSPRIGPSTGPPPAPPAPNAPTMPGTGPGGTQIIPPGPTAPTQPQINCAGTPCVSPYAKTQTGMNGVLNTLGKKGGD